MGGGEGTKRKKKKSRTRRKEKRKLYHIGQFLQKISLDIGRPSLRGKGRKEEKRDGSWLFFKFLPPCLANFSFLFLFSFFFFLFFFFFFSFTFFFFLFQKRIFIYFLSNRKDGRRSFQRKVEAKRMEGNPPFLSYQTTAIVLMIVHLLVLFSCSCSLALALALVLVYLFFFSPFFSFFFFFFYFFSSLLFREKRSETPANPTERGIMEKLNQY